MDALLPFAAALLSLRLAGSLLERRRIAWGAALVAYAIAAGAMAWGGAYGWNAANFRIYYLAGGLLTAPLLGVGSLLLANRRFAAHLGLLYAGLAVGVALSTRVHGSFSAGMPAAQDHLDWLPRVVAIAGNSLGTLAVVVVAVLSIRRRPVGNALILAGIAVAAAGSGLAGLGVSVTSAFVLVAAVLLYLGVAEPNVTLILSRASRARAR
jgi:hypothetical protein